MVWGIVPNCGKSRHYSMADAPAVKKKKRASLRTSRSSALAGAILDRLRSFRDPDLEAAAATAAAPDAPFTRRACAARLRTFAAARWLPEKGALAPSQTHALLPERPQKNCGGRAGEAGHGNCFFFSGSSVSDGAALVERCVPPCVHPEHV